MIIEHKESERFHNVLIKNDAGEIVAVIKNRIHFFKKSKQKQDWRVYTVKNEPISDLLKPHPTDDTNLEDIIKAIEDRFEEIEELAKGTEEYILQLNTEFGFTYYLLEHREICDTSSVLTTPRMATGMSAERAARVAEKLLKNDAVLRYMIADDRIVEVVTCSLTATPVGVPMKAD